MEINNELLITVALAVPAGLVIGFCLGLLSGQRARALVQQKLTESRTQEASSRAALTSLSEQHRELEQVAQAREVRMGVLKSGVANIGQRAQEKDREIASLNRQLTSLRTQFSSLEKDHVELNTRQAERESQHSEQLALLSENRESLKREFENLANRIFENKGKTFTASSRDSLETLLKPFREQINGFQARINQVHSESLRGQTNLESEIRKVLEVGLEMNSQASNLTHALKGDKKTTGNWGEAQLQRTLELAGLQAGEHYEAQAVYRDEQGRRRLPDFVIKLPDSKHLVIDSKVSLVDYDRAISADSELAQTEALNAHARAVHNHIEDLAAKDYSNLPNIGSPDFVLMFMPVEPAYIEAMKHTRDLFNYGYKKGVIMVSHTTLMPILRTVANLWLIDQSHKEAKELGKRAGDIYTQVCMVAERLGKLGNTLKSANNHYNETITSLVGKQGLHGKVERFQQFSNRTGAELVRLEPVHADIETERLATVTETPSKDRKQGDSQISEP